MLELFDFGVCVIIVDVVDLLGFVLKVLKFFAFFDNVGFGDVGVVKIFGVG